MLRPSTYERRSVSGRCRRNQRARTSTYGAVHSVNGVYECTPALQILALPVVTTEPISAFEPIVTELEENVHIRCAVDHTPYLY